MRDDESLVGCFLSVVFVEKIVVLCFMKMPCVNQNLISQAVGGRSLNETEIGAKLQQHIVRQRIVHIC